MADDPQRVTLSLPGEAIGFLRQEADRTGASMAEIVRRSIANTKYLQEAQSNGGDVLLTEPGKKTTKLVFR